MARRNHAPRPKFFGVLVWLALGLAVSVSACVAKPAFHCQSDDACVAADGSRGSCEASGECSFHAALSNPGGAGASNAGSASSDGGSSPGGGGGAAAIDAAGAAGASCTDQAAGSCYACSPKTPAQFLNACTSAACVPFDDQARLTNLAASGQLPPLPPASAQ